MAHVIENNEFCIEQVLLCWRDLKWWFANGKEAKPSFYFGSAPFFELSQEKLCAWPEGTPLLVLEKREEVPATGGSPSILEEPRVLTDSDSSSQSNDEDDSESESESESESSDEESDSSSEEETESESEEESSDEETSSEEKSDSSSD